MPKRFEYIDALKGLAIILMVMGHVLSSFYPDPYLVYESEPRSAMLLFRIIYSFHMPLLIFLSGYVALRLSDYSLCNCASTLWRRFRTLVIPFFTVGMLRYVVTPQYFLDYWFIWILFQFILLTLCIEFIGARIPKYGSSIATIGIVLIALVLQYFNASLNQYDHMPLLDAGHWSLYLFFAAGYLCAKYDTIDRLLNSNWLYTISVVLFFGLTFWVTIWGKHLPLWSKWNCILPLSAIVMFVYLFRNALDSAQNYYQQLIYVGKNSLAIYLLHFFFIPPMYHISSWFIGANAQFVGGGAVFVQFFIAGTVTTIVILLSLGLTKIIETSSILSTLLLGKKYEPRE